MVHPWNWIPQLQGAFVHEHPAIPFLRISLPVPSQAFLDSAEGHATLATLRLVYGEVIWRYRGAFPVVNATPAQRQHTEEIVAEAVRQGKKPANGCVLAKHSTISNAILRERTAAPKPWRACTRTSCKCFPLHSRTCSQPSWPHSTSVSRRMRGTSTAPDSDLDTHPRRVRALRYRGGRWRAAECRALRYPGQAILARSREALREQSCSEPP